MRDLMSDEHIKLYRHWRTKWLTETLIMPWADYVAVMFHGKG